MHRFLSPLRALGLAAFFLVPTPLRGEDLVLGMSAAFRGPSRALGNELYRGAMAYLEDINRSGGVHGRRLVLKAYDDGYNPIPAIENTVRLVEKDHAFLLFGYVGTPTVTRILPLLKRYEDRHIYLFFPFTGAEPQRQPPYGEFVFNLRASYQDETAGLVDHFLQIGRKRIAVFYQIDAYGRSGWDGVRRALTKSGRTIVAEATYKRGTSFSLSLRPQVEILRQADPDAIISVGAYAACAAFVRDARDAGWDIPIANVSFVGSENLLDLLTAAGQSAGKDYTANLINSQVVPSYYNEKLAAVRQYRECMDRCKPQPPTNVAAVDYQPLSYSYVSFEGFLDAKALVEILKAMGPDLDRARISHAAESIHHFDLGIDVPISFSASQHEGLHQVYYTLVRDGRFIRLVDSDWQRWKK